MGILVKTGSEANPNGRPKSEASRLRSEMRDAFCLKTYPKFNELVVGIHNLALEDKDLNAYKMIFDYCLGRPFVQKDEGEKDESVTVFMHILVSELQLYKDRLPLETIKLFKEAVMKAAELSQMSQLSQSIQKVNDENDEQNS